MSSRHGLAEEVSERIARARDLARERGLDALLVYGDSRVVGSLRYLTGYFPDRVGWISTGPERSDVRIFAGAALFLPVTGDPVLLVEPGHMLDQEPCVEQVLPAAQGLRGGDVGLTGRTLTELLGGGARRLGIETWDRFPAPLYLELRQLVPDLEISCATIVEELRMTKSAWELDVMRRAGAVGDLGHQAACDALGAGGEVTEIEVVRAADAAMRAADPIFEDPVPSSPSKISTGTSIRGLLLHIPLAEKRITRGDAVNWDICMRHEGYTIDTSRTRVLGRPSPEMERAYGVSLAMHAAAVDGARPGATAADLRRRTSEIARAAGYELWESFIGHGTGLDCHERPDMGVEATPFVSDMVLCIEPRVVVDGRYLVANEDMVRVTEAGGESLTTFPREPLAL